MEFLIEKLCCLHVKQFFFLIHYFESILSLARPLRSSLTLLKYMLNEMHGIRNKTSLRCHIFYIGRLFLSRYKWLLFIHISSLSLEGYHQSIEPITFYFLYWSILIQICKYCPPSWLAFLLCIYFQVMVIVCNHF